MHFIQLEKSYVIYTHSKPTINIIFNREFNRKRLEKSRAAKSPTKSVT